MAGAAGTGLAITACESTVGISAGHAHDLTVSAEDVLAGEDLTYTTTNVNDHTHDVELTADDLAALAAGEEISTTTTIVNGHDHPVTIVCA